MVGKRGTGIDEAKERERERARERERVGWIALKELGGGLVLVVMFRIIENAWRIFNTNIEKYIWVLCCCVICAWVGVYILFVCVNVSVNVCIFKCTYCVCAVYVCINMHMYVSVHVCMVVHMFVCQCMCVYLSVLVCTDYVCAVCKCTCVYLCALVCI